MTDGMIYPMNCTNYLESYSLDNPTNDQVVKKS